MSMSKINVTQFSDNIVIISTPIYDCRESAKVQ